MHELSIVMSIVELADRHMQLEGASAVDTIELEIGVLAGVEMHALEFAWKCAVKGTVLENAQRLIRHVPGVARCLECNHQFKIETIYSVCPECQSYVSEILQGKELRVKSLTVTHAA